LSATFFDTLTATATPTALKASGACSSANTTARTTLAPLIFWLCFIPIMHWRDRYRGTKPYTWGAFLVFETSGWSKIFYWFMHVLPDRERRGLYRDVP